MTSCATEAPPPEAPTETAESVALGPIGTPPVGTRPVGTPPVSDHSFAPYLTASNDELLLTWIERLESESEQPGHRVQFARWSAGEWSEPSTVTADPAIFANWADTPGVVRGADGALYAHWLGAVADEKYAYSIYLERSADDGVSWQSMGLLPEDDTPTEHGFVSWLPEGDGARAFWLDGRQWVEDGPMSLRTARVSESGVSEAERIDARVCDCCPTSAAIVAGEPVVVYRDRSEEEIRDIYRVGRGSEGWSEPRSVGDDAWRIEGCPVNGPRIDADGSREVVAWFTAAGDEAAVRLAFRGSESVRVDEGKPLGRVAVELAPEGVWAVWLEANGERADIQLRKVSESGELGEVRTIAETSSARASGFPHLVSLGERLVVAWVEIAAAGAPPKVRVSDIEGA